MLPVCVSAVLNDCESIWFLRSDISKDGMAPNYLRRITSHRGLSYVGHSEEHRVRLEESMRQGGTERLQAAEERAEG